MGDAASGSDAVGGGLTAELGSEAKAHPILTGLTTGILIWFTTRMLDRVIFGGKR